MNCYKRSVLEDDCSSMGSVHLSEGISNTTTHIRYHAGVSFWYRRTVIEKWLIVFVIALFFLLIISLFTHSNNSDVTGTPNSNLGYCFTENCINTAANILSSIDINVDPCDNFYQFTCGNWIRSNPVPNGKPMWNTFNKLEYKNEVVMRNALENRNMSCEAERKAKWYYMSCIDKKEMIEKFGPAPMLKFLNNIGGWYVLNNFSINKWDFEKTMYLLHNKYNMASLFSWYVGEDDKNSSTYVIQIDQGGLSLPSRQHYLNETANDKILGAYLEYMTSIGVLLGGDKNSTEEHMKAVITFEKLLAKIMAPDEDRRDEEKMYHKMTIAELDKLSPFMSWLRYFQNAFDQVNHTISKDEEIVVFAPTYLKNLASQLNDGYLKGNNEKNKIVLHNYMIWQAVKRLVPYLSRPFRNELKNFRSVLFGSNNVEEPWRTCIGDTNSVFGMALGALYVREVFHGNSKFLAEQMITNVRKAFTDNFKNLKWMDDQTAKLAVEKAEAVSDLIGFPNFILNGTELDAYYNEGIITSDEYFQNNIRINEVLIKENLDKLGKLPGRTKWSMTPSVVNAYYTTSKNQIVFPAGILQPPFFDKHQLESLNYGSMGVVMGHELTHGFDDQGREYDKYGNLHQWWNNQTIEEFKNRSECFVKQYSKYEVNGKNINGVRTLGENIADNGGLKASYHAYLKKKKGRDPEYSLPGVNYTQEQLFFISFSQVWCSDSTDEAIALMIEKDSHSPNPFRVLGPLSNMKEFSEVFNCSVGSKMNPKDKCELW